MTLQRADVRERLYLARANRESVGVMVGRAAANGLNVVAAVAIVVDQRDHVGKALAELAAARAGLDAADEAARVHARGEVPTAILVVDLDSAVAIFEETHPAVAAGLERSPPSGCVRLVVVAAGGALLIHSEVPLVAETEA